MRRIHVLLLSTAAAGVLLGGRDETAVLKGLLSG
jgi:hypothetical protein